MQYHSEVNESQAEFVPTAAVSLAKVYIMPDGDDVTYLPFCIYHGDVMVGFIMHAYEEKTVYMFWINGLFIDSRYQGRGYGKAAVMKMISYIINRVPHCEEVRLTVHKNNSVAYKLYEKAGFKSSGVVWGDEAVMVKVERGTAKDF